MISVHDTIPTASVTGFGSSPTVVVDPGSVIRSGTITVTCGTPPGTNGTLTVSFGTTFGANACSPVVTYVNGTGSWSTPSGPVTTAQSNTGFTVAWQNTGALSSGSTYKFNYICHGK